MKKVSKYYKDAYNNPKQYSNWDLSKECTSEKAQKMVNDVVSGVTDALRDRNNGTYKFITR